jgi:hypothetical protein
MFNFDVEHIEGIKNIVADGFSRLCLFDEQIVEADFSCQEATDQFDNSSSLPALFARSCPQFLRAMTQEQIAHPIITSIY